METTENKLIASKMQELDTLPPGYAPNLDSKWDLLEASLNGRNKNKRVLYIWARIAAVLILSGFIGTWFIPTAEVKPVVETTKPVLEPLLKQSTAVTASRQKETLKVTEKPTHKVSASQIKNEQTHQPAEQLATLSNVQEDSVRAVKEPAVDLTAATLPVKKKKNRYVQMDFNDAVNQATVAVPVQSYFAKNLQLTVFKNAEPLQNASQTNSRTAFFKINF